MKLSIKARLMIFNVICPREADILTQMTIKSIRVKVFISEEEAKCINMRPSENGVIWNNNVEKSLDVDFTKPELQVLKDSVVELDRNKKVTADLLDTCLKIRNEDISLIRQTEKKKE